MRVYFMSVLAYPEAIIPWIGHSLCALPYGICVSKRMTTSHIGGHIMGSVAKAFKLSTWTAGPFFILDLVYIAILVVLLIGRHAHWLEINKFQIPSAAWRLSQFRGSEHWVPLH